MLNIFTDPIYVKHGKTSNIINYADRISRSSASSV